MIPPKKKPKIRLVGFDGNVFSILGKAKEKLEKAGADREWINEVFIKEATSKDYNHALMTCMKYLKVS